MTHPPTRLGLRLRKPTDRAVTDVVAPADLREGLASLSPRHGLLPLMQRKLQLPPKPYPASLGPSAPFTGAGEDQAPLELNKATKDRYH